MTIAGKFNLLVGVIVASMCALVTGLASVYLYHQAREAERAVLELRLRDQPLLALHLYRSDGAGLQAGLSRLLVAPVQAVSAFDSQGEVLWSEGPGVANFEQLRRELLATDTAVQGLDGRGDPVGVGLAGALLDSERRIHLSIPVVSGINPLDRGVSPERFLAGAAGETGARHVHGYVQLALVPRDILRSVLPAIAAVAGACLVFAVLSTWISRRYTRRLTAPIARLARAADDLASGRLEKPVQAGGSGEIEEIAAILNGVFSGISSYKTRMDVDHQLLSMKVEERTFQLSRRNEELSKAVQQVTRTKNRLRQLAYYDSLTALPNRRLFTEQLSLLLRLARRNQEQLALLFLDLDNFKRINDSLGHSAGDLLLREVGSRLATCVRESDVVAHYVDPDMRIGVSRLGGDEFTVVLNHIDGAGAACQVAQRLLDALAQPMLIDGHELVITPSLGIALAPDHAEDVEGLLRCADSAMYHAKAAGKNNFLVYDSQMEEAGLDRLTLETDLRRALDRNEIVLYYQPQVDTNSGAVVGAEALMRWRHPEQGLIPPQRFIPLAEEMGLIGSLGEWAIREACLQVKRYAEQGLKLPRVAVNVSALQFGSRFIRRVRTILEETGVDPGVLQLELTEGVVMGDTVTSVQALGELKELGVSLSIDDFGTGYSSLGYLSRFPLDELKIDRGFVTAAANSEEEAALVVAIIAMARGLGLEVVVEGVETREQFLFITGQGAHVIQGFLFSEPLPEEEFANLLSPWHFSDQVRELAGGQG